MEKPVGIKVISAIIYFRLIIVFLFIIRFILSSTILFTNPFWHGFQVAVLKKSGIKNTTFVTARQYGEICGRNFVPILLVILSLLYLKRRNYKVLVTVLVISAFVSLKNIFSLGLSVVLLMILFCDRKTKSYLKGSLNEKSPDESSISN